MNILSTQVSLRNDSASSIILGSLTILSGSSAVIWDTVNYTTNTDNFKQTVDNISVFNENIGNGNLIMVIDTVDQSSSEAWDNYKELYLTFNRENIEKKGFSVLRLGEEETKGLVISHSNLTDLTNDDHSQYLLTNGGRSLTGDLDVGGNNITNVELVDGIDLVSLDGYVDNLLNNNDITKEPTGFTNPEGIIINYNSTNRTVTLTGDVEAYYHGELLTELTSGWISSAHSSTTGVTYFLYYNGIDFIWSTSVWSFEYLQIATVYFGTNSFCLRECHGLMQWQVHRELHETIGTYLSSGGDLSNYVLSSTTVADRRPFISETKLSDEDLITTLPALSTNSYTWLYLTGANVSTTSIGNSDIINLLGNRPYYNQFTGEAWQQTLFNNNEYAKIFVIGIPASSDTGSQSIRYVFLQPQQTSPTLSVINSLTSNSVNLGDIGSSVPEYNFFAEIVIRYQGGNWTFVSVNKLTGTRVSQISTPAGSYLSFVSVDGTTITGDGTSGSPLVASLSNLVVGPATSTDNAIARFDLATGKLIQDSAVIVGDTGIITGVSTINGVTVETHASRHNPGGADALALGTPSTLVVGGSNTAGTATSFVRSDHIHALPAFGTTLGTFCQGNDSRLSDDRTASGLRTATTVVSISGSTAPTAGQVLKATSSTAATWQNDTVGTGDVVGPGSATDNAIARFDTITGKLIQDSVVLVGDTGIITGVLTINGVTVETHASRHLPGGDDALTTAAPSTIGTANAEGNATSLARSNHVHSHGNQTVGTLHAAVSNTTNGFMTAVGASGTIAQSTGTTAAWVTELTNPQKVSVRKNTGTNVGSRPRLNFIEGSNVTLTIADDATDNEVDITINSTASGTGDVVGPGSATDNAIARFDLATGKLIQDSVVIVGDTGIITGVSTINGVTVETHASRHNPGGADALALGTPSTLVVGGSNTAGTATSFVRSDHIHALPAFGTTLGTFCQGNDSRLSDDRTASGLRTATTVVSISGATAPTSGQALVATSSTAATWQTIAAGGLTAPINPDEDGYVAIASSGDLTYLHGGTANNVLTWDSGGFWASSPVKRTVMVEYTLTDDVNNTIDWFTTWRSAGGDTVSQKKSGSNNGIQNQNSCSPFVVPFNATITKAVLVLSGAGVQDGSVIYPVVYQTDLYLESFSSESKLADIDFSISNLYTVGNYSPGDTRFTGSITLSISVNEGDMLALKFINGTGSSVVGQSRNAFIVLVLEEV